MNNRALSLGILIIAAGVVIVLGKLGVIAALIRWFWPLAVLAAGAALFMAAAGRSLPPIVYVPAALLAGGSLTLLLCAWFGWHLMNALWPVWLLSAAFGLYRYAEAERLPPMRKTAIALGIVSVLLWIAALVIHANGYIVALVLIVAGIAIIIRRPKWR